MQLVFVHSLAHCASWRVDWLTVDLAVIVIVSAPVLLNTSAVQASNGPACMQWAAHTNTQAHATRVCKFLKDGSTGGR